MLRKRSFSFLMIFFLVMGSWKGYAALFEPGKDEPRQIFPCPVDTLPEADRIALEKGIPIRNARDLQQVLEDYLS